MALFGQKPKNQVDFPKLCDNWFFGQSKERGPILKPGNKGLQHIKGARESVDKVHPTGALCRTKHQAAKVDKVMFKDGFILPDF